MKWFYYQNSLITLSEFQIHVNELFVPENGNRVMRTVDLYCITDRRYVSYVFSVQCVLLYYRLEYSKC